jgi:uncharacterized protein YoxC
MSEIFDLIIQHVSTWLPALASLLVMFVGIIPTILKVKGALDEIKRTKEFEDVTVQLKILSNENKELIRCNKLLLDRITKIEGYSDTIKKE